MSTTPAEKEETVLVTRFCCENMTAYGGFIWPTSGPVSCSDWDPTPECGQGLHGWLHGKGDAEAWCNTEGDKMLVVEVLKSDLVVIDDGEKVKFPKGNVVHCGTRASVTQYMAERGHVGIIWGHMTVGDNETAEVGDRGFAVAGNGGKALAGVAGTAIAGKRGLAIAGAYGKATVGKGGHAEVGVGGKAKGGYCATLTFGVPFAPKLAQMVLSKTPRRPGVFYLVDWGGVKKA